MRARGDKLGVGSVALGIVLLAAGFSLLVPHWVLDDGAVRREPEAAPHSVAPSVARAQAVPTPLEAKDTPGPRPHVEHVKGSTGASVEVVRAAGAPTSLARFAEQALVKLTPDEEALLREEPVDDLAALVTRTERAYQDATPETRAEKERRYLSALNLSAKLAAPPAPSALDDRARETEARYQRELAAERVKWKDLPPEEQARQQEAFKEWFFRREETR
ncbi:hypothetical protein ACLESO_32710 [Pyxidicoccus sp. 3LG]